MERLCKVCLVTVRCYRKSSLFNIKYYRIKFILNNEKIFLYINKDRYSILGKNEPTDHTKFKYNSTLINDDCQIIKWSKNQHPPILFGSEHSLQKLGNIRLSPSIINLLRKEDLYTRILGYEIIKQQLNQL